MARRPNTTLQKQIHAAAEQVITADPFTSCVVKTVTDQVWRELFVGKTYNQAYQMVSYYLRGNNKYIKKQNRYRPVELENLLLMNAAGRSEYALARGVTPASVEQAVKRYFDNLNRPPAPLDRPWFNFSRRADLSTRGFSLEDVKACREYLEENCGLALRAPNILYHPKTKKRYTMSDTEQVALLMNPKQFLRTRAAHIKENWVEKEADPVYDPDEAFVIDASAPVTPSHTRLVGKLRRLSASIEKDPPTSVKSIMYVALSNFVNKSIKILNTVETSDEGGTK